MITLTDKDLQEQRTAERLQALKDSPFVTENFKNAISQMDQSEAALAQAQKALQIAEEQQRRYLQLQGQKTTIVAQLEELGRLPENISIGIKGWETLIRETMFMFDGQSQFKSNHAAIQIMHLRIKLEQLPMTEKELKMELKKVNAEMNALEKGILA